MSRYFLVLGLNYEYLTEDGDDASEIAKRMKSTYRVISGCEARQYVRDGRHHMTALFVDVDGKVRRAREGS